MNRNTEHSKTHAVEYAKAALSAFGFVGMMCLGFVIGLWLAVPGRSFSVVPADVKEVAEQNREALQSISQGVEEIRQMLRDQQEN